MRESDFYSPDKPKENIPKISHLFLEVFCVWGGTLALGFFLDVFFQEGNECLVFFIAHALLMLFLSVFYIPFENNIKYEYGFTTSSYNTAYFLAVILVLLIGYLFLAFVDYDKLFPNGGFLAGIGMLFIYLLHLAGAMLCAVIRIIYAVVKRKKRIRKLEDKNDTF